MGVCPGGMLRRQHPTIGLGFFPNGFLLQCMIFHHSLVQPKHVDDMYEMHDPLVHGASTLMSQIPPDHWTPMQETLQGLWFHAYVDPPGHPRRTPHKIHVCVCMGWAELNIITMPLPAYLLLIVHSSAIFSLGKWHRWIKSLITKKEKTDKTEKNWCLQVSFMKMESSTLYRGWHGVAVD